MEGGWVVPFAPITQPRTAFEVFQLFHNEQGTADNATFKQVKNEDMRSRGII